MDLLTFLGLAQKGLSTAATLRSFVEDELGSLLQATGEATYSAAARAWADAHRSQNSDKDIDDVRVLMRNAYEQLNSALSHSKA